MPILIISFSFPSSVMRACEAFKAEKHTPFERMAEYFEVRKEMMADMKGEPCYDMHWDIPAGANATVTGADWSGMGEGEIANAWEFQCCRDLIIRTGFGPNSMMLPRPFDLDWLEDHCQSRFQVSPEPNRMNDNWHFDDLVGNGGSHILFTNGLNDGWSPLSYTEDLSDTIVALNMPTGAHHSDLNHVRSWESCGTKPGQECDDVIEVQKQIPVVLQKWVDEVKALSQK
jgi:lysosomal Pro-X carboxypeptidase